MQQLEMGIWLAATRTQHARISVIRAPVSQQRRTRHTLQSKRHDSAATKGLRFDPAAHTAGQSRTAGSRIPPKRSR